MMQDKELIELRRKVKEKQQKQRIEDEKQRLREKLEKNSFKGKLKIIGKSLLKRLEK